MTLAQGSIDEYNALQACSVGDFLIRYELYIKDIERRIGKTKTPQVNRK